MHFLSKKEQEEMEAELLRDYKELTRRQEEFMKEIKGEFKEVTKTTPKDMKESLIANFRKLVVMINYKSESAKYVVEFHLNKIKETCGIQEANHLIQRLDLEKLYKIKPFKK